MKAREVVFLLILIAGLLVWHGLADQSPVAAIAQSETTAPGSISVSGSSAIRVQPDRVVVLLGVESFATTPSGAREQNARRSQAVVAAVCALGVADRDIATANFVIQPRYDDYDHDVISGYWAQNSIAITLRDVSNLEPVLVAALEAGATTVDGVEFSVTDLRALRDQAREQAIHAALEKAQDMASAAGVTLGSVTHIAEDSGYHYFGSWTTGRQWTNFQNVVQDLSAEGALTLEDGSISLGQVVVQAQVSLTVALR